MFYTLYIRNENCNRCDEILDFIERKQLQCTIINLDEGGEKPPKKVFTYPVMFKDDELIAYGLDIIEFFQAGDKEPEYKDYGPFDPYAKGLD